MKLYLHLRTLVAVASLVAGTQLRGDLPPRWMSELVPPTEADWYRIELIKRRLYPVEHCCAKPILVYHEVYYYPCPGPIACGEATHRSFRGTYGIRHPMPYYIKEPKFEVPPPPWNCRSCSTPQTPPSPYQPIVRN